MKVELEDIYQLLAEIREEIGALTLALQPDEEMPISQQEPQGASPVEPRVGRRKE